MTWNEKNQLRLKFNTKIILKFLELISSIIENTTWNKIIK